MPRSTNGKDFADKYSDLVQWMQDDLTHRLAKKLTRSEVDEINKRNQSEEE